MVDAEQHEAKLRAEKLQQAIDLQNEITGAEVGRIHRDHLVRGANLRNAEVDAGSKEKDTARLIIREIRRSEEFQRQLEVAQARLMTYETMSYEALMEAQQTRELLWNKIRDMRRGAHRLEDGRAVFLSEDGTWAVDEDGEHITDEELASVEWTNRGDTAEDYLELKQQLQEAEAEVSEIEHYRDGLDEMGATLANEDLSEQDLDTLMSDMDQLPDALTRRQAQADRENGPDAPSTTQSASPSPS